MDAERLERQWVKKRRHALQTLTQHRVLLAGLFRACDTHNGFGQSNRALCLCVFGCAGLGASGRDQIAEVVSGQCVEQDYCG